eukprot:EG_transcript_23141
MLTPSSSSTGAATHDPYSLGGGLGSKTAASPVLHSVEGLLLDIIIDMLEDYAINPHHGSVSLEKLQSTIAQHRPGYLRLALRRHRTFADFVAAHPHLFHVFLSHSGKKRIRYALHVNWQAADAENRSSHRALCVYIERALADFLRTQPQRCGTVTAFIEAYPTLPCNVQGSRQSPPPSLPKRGDLVRMIRHWNQRFQFDSQSHTVTLRASGALPKEPSLSTPRPMHVSHLAARM